MAGPGEDETVLCVRRGPRIVLLQAWAGKDPRGDVLAALMPFKDRLQSVNVDSVGIGYYMAKHLKDQSVNVQEVNVGEKAYDPEKYANRKAELYWGLRARTQAGDIAGLTDERAIAQLAGIRYSHNSRGQVVIESKDEARKRGVKSPDRAEAVMLAFANLERVFGFLEFLREEVERLKTGSGKREHPDHCPRCQNACLSLYSDSWKCGACGAAGTTGAPTTPPCPKCESAVVVQIGCMWRCNLCGEQLGERPEVPKLPSRGEFLRAREHGFPGVLDRGW